VKFSPLRKFQPGDTRGDGARRALQDSVPIFRTHPSPEKERRGHLKKRDEKKIPVSRGRERDPAGITYFMVEGKRTKIRQDLRKGRNPEQRKTREKSRAEKLGALSWGPMPTKEGGHLLYCTERTVSARDKRRADRKGGRIPYIPEKKKKSNLPLPPHEKKESCIPGEKEKTKKGPCENGEKIGGVLWCLKPIGPSSAHKGGRGRSKEKKGRHETC